jgi:hypothetical protein
VGRSCRGDTGQPKGVGLDGFRHPFFSKILVSIIFKGGSKEPCFIASNEFGKILKTKQLTICNYVFP